MVSSIHTPAFGSAYNQSLDLSKVNWSTVANTTSTTPPVQSKAGQDFMSPGMSAMLTGGLEIAKLYYSGQISKYETQRKNAVAEQQYYRAILNKEKENHRNYEVDLRNWHRDADWVEMRRQYEQKRKDLQAAYKGEATIAATQNFERMIANIEGRFYEEEAAEIIQLDNIRTEFIAAAAKKVASGQVGRSVRAVRDQYEQQYLANLSNRTITRRNRIQDKENQKLAAEVARENTVNATQFYTPTPIADPVKPLAPLPVEGVPPTPEIQKGGLGIDIGLKVLDTYQNYIDMQPDRSVNSSDREANTKPNVNVSS